MSREKIRIIQNILKKENRYDIALLLENAYFLLVPKLPALECPIGVQNLNERIKCQ